MLVFLRAKSERNSYTAKVYASGPRSSSHFAIIAMHYCFTFSRMTDSPPVISYIREAFVPSRWAIHVIVAVLLLEHAGTKRWPSE